MLSHDAESNLSSSSFMRLIIVLQCHSTVLVHSNVSSDQSLTRLSLPPEARRPFFTSVRTFTQSLSAVMLFLQVRLVLSHIFIHLSFLLMQNIHHLICIDTRLLFHVFHCFCLPFLSIDHTLIAQSSPAERSRLRLKGEYRKFLYFLL